MALSIYEGQLGKCLKLCRKEIPVCSQGAPILANMANFTTENNTCCFRIGPAFLDTKLEEKWFFDFDEFL